MKLPGKPVEAPGSRARLFFGAAALGLTLLTASSLAALSELSWSACYLVAASCAALVLCGYDKSIAASDALRVPEAVLLAAALLGGTPGLLIGMNLFRHKTLKARFQLQLAVILIIQIALVSLLRRL